MLEFNIGELAARARNLLGVRGRIPFGLDESVVGTVRLADADHAPFRQTGLEFAGSIDAQTSSAAGRYAGVGIFIDDANGQDAFVIERFKVSALNYNATTGAVAAFPTAWIAGQYFQPYPTIPAGFAAGAFLRSPEQQALVNKFGLFTPARFITSVVSAPVTLTDFGGVHRPGDENGPWTECEIPLRSGFQFLAFNNTPADGTNQARVSLSIVGRFWPSGYAP